MPQPAFSKLDVFQPCSATKFAAYTSLSIPVLYIFSNSRAQHKRDATMQDAILCCVPRIRFVLHQSFLGSSGVFGVFCVFRTTFQFCHLIVCNCFVLLSTYICFSGVCVFAQCVHHIHRNTFLFPLPPYHKILFCNCFQYFSLQSLFFFPSQSLLLHTLRKYLDGRVRLHANISILFLSFSFIFIVFAMSLLVRCWSCRFTCRLNANTKVSGCCRMHETAHTHTHAHSTYTELQSYTDYVPSESGNLRESNETPPLH